MTAGQNKNEGGIYKIKINKKILSKSHRIILQNHEKTSSENIT